MRCSSQKIIISNILVNGVFKCRVLRHILGQLGKVDAGTFKSKHDMSRDMKQSCLHSACQKKNREQKMDNGLNFTGR